MTKALEEALLQHFIYQKLDIAYAINKPFPFFEALRDNSFITEKMYKVRLVDPSLGSPVLSNDAPLLSSQPTAHQAFQEVEGSAWLCSLWMGWPGERVSWAV